MPMYNGYPMGYQPYPYYPQYQPAPQQATVQQPPQQEQQMQSGGFIPVQNEKAARDWPIAPGVVITFKDENAPYCYTKSRGFSPFEQARFEKYRLVKEEDAPIQPVQNTAVPSETAPAVDLTGFALKDDLDALRGEIEDLKTRLDKPATKKAKEDATK